jgi:protein gp37
MPTKIEWTDETWNPVTGCQPDFPCWQRCYARRMANRLAGRFGYDADEPFKPTLHADKLTQPARWRSPRRIFVCSMGDLFCSGVKERWRRLVFGAIIDSSELAGNYGHTFMLLTKRPEAMYEYFQRVCSWMKKPLGNLWLGISASTQAELDERWEHLREIPAAVRFVSLEPLLEEVEWSRYGLKNLDWIIAGPETGPGARPMDLDWVRAIRDRCQDAQVPFFYKRGPLDGVMYQEFPK